MRRMLQQLGPDGGYYAGSGQWTKDPGQAQVFVDSLSAIQCCVRDGLYGVELVIHFEQGPDVRLPVLPAETSNQRFRPQI